MSIKMLSTLLFVVCVFEIDVATAFPDLLEDGGIVGVNPDSEGRIPRTICSMQTNNPLVR